MTMAITGQQALIKIAAGNYSQPIKALARSSLTTWTKLADIMEVICIN